MYNCKYVNVEETFKKENKVGNNNETNKNGIKNSSSTIISKTLDDRKQNFLEFFK